MQWLRGGSRSGKVMRRALLDTDILSEVLKGRNADVRHCAEAYGAQYGRLLTSTITVLEIVKGLHKAGKAEQLDSFLRTVPTLEVLALDQDAAILAGRIYAYLERKGIPIGRADPMIAAIALTAGCQLVTGNTEHFSRIRLLGYDLDLADWRQPGDAGSS